MASMIETEYEYCDLDERYNYYDGEESEYEPIIWEIMAGRDDLLPKTIETHPDKLNQRSSVIGQNYTPLFLAVMLDLSSTVTVLLEHKADPLVPDPRGFLPIHKAFRPAKLDIIYKLLDPNLVDEVTIEQMLNAPDYIKETALHHAARAWLSLDARCDLIQYMIKYGARPCRNIALKFPSELFDDKEVNKLLKQCEVMEFLKYHEGRGLPDSGYDENIIKQDKVEIESEFNNNKSSANSKFPCKDKKFKKFFKQYEVVEFLRYYEVCGLPDTGYDENNIKQDKVETESEFDNNKTSANSKDGETQLEIDLIAKDGETTKNIVKKLKPKLQKEASLEKKLCNSSLNPVVAEDGNDKDNGKAHQNVSGTFKNGVQVDKNVSKNNYDYPDTW